MALTLEQLTKQVAASGLLSTDGIQSWVASLPEKSKPRDGEALARELVKQKRLTAYQAQEIYAGRGKGLTLGNYVVLDKLGQGGMGMVLKAEHRRMDRIVALKVLAPNVTKTPEALKRFDREVKAAAKLRHPNIVAADDADEANGVHFLVMEFIEGSDLSALIKKGGPIALDKALHCVLQAARGLEYAHSRGVVHRDIKPANLLLDKEGVVKILDMGIARLESAGAQQDDLTGTGQIMGTVDYMAPEQALNTKNADARADIYSLGATLWYLLTGKAMYTGETAIETLMAHQTQPIPALSQQGNPVAKPLQKVFEKMVAKATAARYQSMTEVIAELEVYRSGLNSAPPIAGGVGEDTRMNEFFHSVGGTAGSARPLVAVTSASPQVIPVAKAWATVDAGLPQIETHPQTQASGPGLGPWNATASKAISGNMRGKKPPVKLIAAGAAAFLFLLLGVWVIIRDKSGNEVARVQVPEGGTATVQVETASKPPVTLPVEASTTKPSLVKVTDSNPSVTSVTQQAGLLPVAKRAPASLDAALKFDGDDFVDIPSLKFDPLGSYTLEGFITSPVKANQGAGLVFGMPEQSYLSFTRMSDWRWVYVPGKNAGVSAAIAGAPARQARTHLACVRDGQTHHLYVDGKLFSKTATIPSPTGGTSPFQIGPEFRGIIDELRVSKVARYKADFTPPERFQTDADTLGLYHFDEAAGNILKDSSGHNHHGKITGAKWVRADGSELSTIIATTLDTALEFDGDAYVDIPTLPFDANTTFTWEVFVAKPQTKPSSNAGVVVGVGSKSRSFSSFDRGIEPGQSLAFMRVGHWRWKYGAGGDKDGAAIVGATPRSERTHLACVHEGQVYRLFVDGKLYKSTNYDEPREADGIFQIGPRFVGLIDEVRISKVARYKADFTPPGRFETDTDTLGLYHFDEAAGDVLNDSSGHNHHGKINGAKWVRADGSAIASDVPQSTLFPRVTPP